MLLAIANKIIAVAFPDKVIGRNFIKVAAVAIALAFVKVIFGISEGNLIVFVNSLVNCVDRVVNRFVIGLGTVANINRALKVLGVVLAC